MLLRILAVVFCTLSLSCLRAREEEQLTKPSILFDGPMVGITGSTRLVCSFEYNGEILHATLGVSEPAGAIGSMYLAQEVDLVLTTAAGRQVVRSVKEADAGAMVAVKHMDTITWTLLFEFRDTHPQSIKLATVRIADKTIQLASKLQ